MKERRRASNNKRVTYLLLALAVILLLGSAVGSTRAALTYQSQNYEAEIIVSRIGVTLLENGKGVSWRNYTPDNEWNQGTNDEEDLKKGELLTEMIPEGEKLVLNKDYKEELAVTNSGTIDEYVRVRIYRSWKDKEGNKITTLSPEHINIKDTVNSDEWIERKTNSKECIELYYKGILKPGEKTEPFADKICIDDTVVVDGVEETLTKDVEIRENTKTGEITMVYKYDGVQFFVDVDVDAVQTHNAKDAIMSSWGVDASNVDGKGNSIL